MLIWLVCSCVRKRGGAEVDVGEGRKTHNFLYQGSSDVSPCVRRPYPTTQRKNNGRVIQLWSNVASLRLDT